MLRDLLKTALRSLLKNKGFTILNVFGLALGLTSCLLILLYVVDERNYDLFNVNADRIFRVNTDTKFGLATTSRAISSSAVAPALIKDFPEVEKAIRLLPDEEFVKKGNELILEGKGAFADAELFNVFTLPMLEGDPKTALSQPHSLVMTESMAKKYFNKTEVIGKTLSFFEDSIVHRVTGVIRDIPKESHFHFDYFLSMVDVQSSYNDRMNVITPFHTYILLKQGANVKNLEKKFPNLLRANLDFYDAMIAEGDYFRLNLTPLTWIHLRSNKSDELSSNGNIEYVRIFSAVAFFILLIACINFMNLSTARSFHRAREVAVRKVLGSTRKYLIAQFLLESILTSLAATFLAILSAWASIPLFNHLSGKIIALSMDTLLWLFPSLMLIILTVGLLAGSYPALFLSGFSPLEIIKGKLSLCFKKSSFRSFLVIFQFSTSITLIIGTLIIYKQLHFIQNKDVGFIRNQVIVVKNMNDLRGNQAKILRQEVKKLPGVINASISEFLPTNDRRWTNYFHTKTTNLQTQYWAVDEDYLTTMGMKLTQGRNFSLQFQTDSSAIIINETAARMLGFSTDALNKELYYAATGKEYHIIGVVKDFNFSSLRENVTPVVMTISTPWTRKEGEEGNYLIIRESADYLKGIINRIEKEWQAFSPPEHFSFTFMDEDFNTIYQDEQRMGKIFVVFTALAIIIACLGLFGLSAYAAEQRAKEISIRKVLGASVKKIIILLSRDFINLVVIAMLLSFPLSWFLMQKWLMDFAYRISIDWWLLGIAGLAAILIAFFTISFQSLKAANSNPVNSLRAE